jgi:PAS domain S-box-containing protein
MTKAAILVVDDTDSGRYIKTRVLRNAGFHVEEAATAAQALDHLEEHAAHVAILDVKLPDMHGFELCRVIKARFPGVSILQTSATFTSPEDRVAGLDVGADAYLVEPMEETELVATVRALLRVRRAEAAQRASEAQFAQFAEASPDALWIYDIDANRLEYVSPSFEGLFGLNPQDAIRDPQRWFSSVHKDHANAIVNMIDSCLAGNQKAIEYGIVQPDGSKRWIRDKAFVLPTQAGQKRRIAGFARDITESKRTEQQRNLLIGELNHRVKNTLAIVQSIASHSRQAALSPDEFHQAFTSRLHALAEAHDLLTQTHWKGALLQQVIDAALKPFAGNENALGRISANGPVVWIAANTAVTLTLAFHELATNATKYGALSNDNGRIDVAWTPEPAQPAQELHLHWREKGGPPVTPPTRKGFGSMLMEKVLAYEADCQAQLAFPPTGLEFHFRLPLSQKVSLV